MLEQAVDRAYYALRKMCISTLHYLDSSQCGRFVLGFELVRVCV